MPNAQCPMQVFRFVKMTAGPWLRWGFTHPSWYWLTAAAAGVKTGGTLVYSVCTITPTETTGVVNEFLKARPEFKLDPFPHPIHKTPTNGTLLIWPEESDSDAMFIARMVRTSETKAKKLAPPKDNPVNT